MEKKFVIIGIIAILINVGLSGCEQFFTDSDLVRVNVMVAVMFTVVDEEYTPLNISLDGAKVVIKVFKNGLDRMLFERIVQKGLCRATDSVQLTKGDWIQCIVIVPDGYRNCYPITNGSALLNWENAHANMNLAGVYNWYPHITITMMQYSTQ